MKIMRSQLFIAVIIAVLFCLNAEDAQRREPQEADLDDAWGSETFSSSAAEVKGRVEEAVGDTFHSSSASPEAQMPQKPAPPQQVVPLKELLKHVKLKDFWAEGLALAFALLYVVNIFVGARQNKRIAAAWIDAFAGEGGTLRQQFSQLGMEDEEGKQVTLLREGPSMYRFYATGRRYCAGVTATFDLRARQDLFMGHLLHAVVPQDDILDFEVLMNEAVMPQTVGCVGTVRLVRDMLRREDAYEDLRTYTRKLDVARERLPGWPGDRLTALAEQASVFYAIITPDLMDMVFGRAAFEECGQYFRALRFTSEDSGKHKQVLQLSLRLPPPERMTALARWVTALMALIDALGQCKLTPEQKSKAEKARAEVPVKGKAETEEERAEKEEERRAAKKKEEQEKLKRMSPAEREKYQARKAKVEQARRSRKIGKGLSVARL